MLKISCVPIRMIMGMFLQKISWFLIWGARLDGLSHGNHFLQCPGVTAETILSVMLEKPFEEFWVAERCRLSFALPEEPRGRRLHQCHGCLWFWWVTVSGSVGGFWEDPFVTVSLEDGRCGEVSGQIMIWKLGLETKDSTVPLPLWRALELRVMKLKKVPGWCVLPSMASLWSSSPLQRPVSLLWSSCLPALWVEVVHCPPQRWKYLLDAWLQDRCCEGGKTPWCGSRAAGETVGCRWTSQYFTNPSSFLLPLLLFLQFFLSFSCHPQKGCVKRQNGLSFSKPSEKP